MLVHILLKPLPELGQVFPFKSQSGGVSVASEVYKQVAAALYSRVNVKSRDAACRAGGKVSVTCQYHRGADINLRKPRGDDAHHAFLPVLVVQDDARVALLALYALDDEVRLFGHLLVDVLALFVVFVDVLSLFQSRYEVFLNQQVHAFASVLHAPGCVYARSNLENDVAHGQFTPVQTTYIDNCLKPDVRVFVQLLQSVIRQYAVFLHHGNDVCRDAYGAEVEQRYEL